MKILRSVTRRGFSFGTAGWFTVLKPNTWFPATRLPVSHRYRVGQSPLDISPAATAPKIITLPSEQRGIMRPALTILAAVAITWTLLWWIMHP